MINLYQIYALVTAEGWSDLLSDRWPDALQVGEYRALVFTNDDYPKLKEQYSSADFKELTTHKTIESMSNGEVGPFVCSIEQLKEVIKHFNSSTEIKT